MHRPWDETETGEREAFAPKDRRIEVRETRSSVQKGAETNTDREEDR